MLRSVVARRHVASAASRRALSRAAAAATTKGSSCSSTSHFGGAETNQGVHSSTSSAAATAALTALAAVAAAGGSLLASSQPEGSLSQYHNVRGGSGSNYSSYLSSVTMCDDTYSSSDPIPTIGTSMQLDGKPEDPVTVRLVPPPESGPDGGPAPEYDGDSDTPMGRSIRAFHNALDNGEEEEEEEESSSMSGSDDEEGSWISWFCSLRGNEFFCEVDEDYIQDAFNLTGLNTLVPYYDYALDMVLDVEMPMEDELTEEQQEIVESAAEMLYGLIHARYVVTNRGMHAMYEKYRTATFGRCPNVFCQGQPVLPVGLSDLPRNYTVNVFCPRCHGLYFPKSTRQANVDGAYFGTTFPHLFLLTHPDMIMTKPTQQYRPRVYGFKIHRSSLYHRNHEIGGGGSGGNSQQSSEQRHHRGASGSKEGRSSRDRRRAGGGGGGIEAARNKGR
mmetsp:Transcript_8639/g.19531  ORF Transcript_8639/g.19531 Transcript_8639/m.19531 type:complete len:447 (-) Transcript_8639:51-1391(-)